MIRKTALFRWLCVVLCCLILAGVTLQGITSVHTSAGHPEGASVHYTNSFDSETALDDFLGFYAADGSTGALGESSAGKYWHIADGALVRNDQAGEQFDETHLLSALYLSGKQFSDFELTVNYSFGWTPGRLEVGFGSTELGKSANHANGGSIVAVNSSNTVSAFGNLTGYVTGTGSGSANAVNELKLTVSGGKLTAAQNGEKVLEKALTGYDGGYIYLAATKVAGGKFDNLTIDGIAWNDPSLSYTNTFDDGTSLTDFRYYYSDNTLPTGKLATDGVLKEQTSPAFWSVSGDGRLTRNDQWSDDYNDTYDNNHLITALSYQKQTFQNFRLDMDFRWNTLGFCHGRFFVLFGQKDPASYVNKIDGGVAAVVKEVNDNTLSAELYGNLKNGISTAAGSGNASNSKTDPPTHHMTLIVNDSQAQVYVDGTLCASANLPTYYDGYIAIAANKNINAWIDNLQIRALAETVPDDGSYYKNDFSGSDLNSVLNGFEAFYAENAGASGGVLAPEALNAHWHLSDGRLLRNDQWGEKFDEQLLLAMLTYTAQKYSEFELSCNYTFGVAPGRMMIGFGQETKGNYVTADGGGLALVIDAYGNVALKGKVGGKSYSQTVDCSALKQASTPVKVTVYDGYLTVFFGGSVIINTEVPEMNGYISLMASKVPNGVFDDLVIRDFTKVTVDPAKQKKIVSAEAIPDLHWDLTAENGTMTRLPSVVSVTTDKSTTEKCCVVWTSEDYKANRPGTFHYTGKLIPPAGGEVINPDNVTASAKLIVVSDYDPESTAKFNFNTFTDVASSLDGFKAYYAENVGAVNGIMEEEPLSAHWSINNKQLYRNDQPGEQFEETMLLSMLTYTEKKYTDFSMDVDYRFGAAPGRMILGIGQETPGHYLVSGEDGLVLVMDASRMLTLKGTVNGKTYSRTVSAAEFTTGGIDHINITSYAGFVTVTYNGNVLMDVNIPGINGYVSLGASKVPGGTYDNLIILDYTKVKVDPEKQRKIVSVDSLPTVHWDRTEDNANVLSLPATLNVKTDKGTEETCRISWTSDDYKPNLPGTFHFKGNIVPPAGGEVINPDGIAASAEVVVTVDYNPATTVKYYIDSLDDFSAEFKNYYASNGASEDLEEKPIGEVYTMENGILRRMDGAGDYGDDLEINSLVYLGKTFRNFQLDLDFCQGGNTPGQAMAAFGIDDVNAYVTFDGGGVAAYMTMEGLPTFRGLTETCNDRKFTTALSVLPGYHETEDDPYAWKSHMHHMTLVVTKRKALMYIDGEEVLETRLRSNYMGGYISMMSNKNTAMFDNFTVTALDYNGVPITFAQAAALPDTFDEDDPLIGEEADDGSAVLITGIAYRKGASRFGSFWNAQNTSVNGKDSDGKGENGYSYDTETLPTTGDRSRFALYATLFALAVTGLLLSARDLRKRIPMK